MSAALDFVKVIMESMKRFWYDHPVLSNWAILAVGMVIILYFSAACGL